MAIRHWHKQLGEFLWSSRHAARSPWQRKLLWIGRVLYRLGDDVMSGDITLRAMSLVFTTLLAIVPLLAVSFSVLKGFGINQLEPVLLSALEPLGEKGAEAAERIIEFVENIKVGVLGSMGFALLFYSAFSLIQKVESAFNAIWRLKVSRSLLRRMSDYLSVLLIGPVLVFTSIGLSASMMSSEVVQSMLAIEPLGSLYRMFARLVPYLLIIAAFTFFYIFIPNTRVRFRYAVWGGVVSGIVWQSASWLFAGLVVYSTRYTAIYSGFAILIFFMMWVYLNWLILLLGADLVYHLQHPEYLKSARGHQLPGMAEQEYRALQVLTVIGRRYYESQGGASIERLVGDIQVPGEQISETLEQLKRGGIITESLEQPGVFLPARPFDTTTVKQALDAVRQSQKLRLPSSGDFAFLQTLVEQKDKCLHQVFNQVSLKELALGRGDKQQ